MHIEVYNIFGKVLVSSMKKMSFVKLNSVAVKCGVIVPPDLCYKWLYDLLRATTINPNSTFYKQWSDIRDKSRIEIALDQILHYSTTYGTNFEGEAWVPNDFKFPEFEFKNLKVLEPITEEEVIEKSRVIAYGGGALSEETISFLEKYMGEHLDVYKVTNRQLKMRLIDDDYEFGSGQECLNWILWKWYGISMLVKNKETLSSIESKVYVNKAELSAIKDALSKNKVILSSCFKRNKDVFLSIKLSDRNGTFSTIINKIRKLSDKHHKPMKRSPWLMLCELSKEQRKLLFEGATIFKLVQVYNALNNIGGYYVIRNGKSWYKDIIVRNTPPEVLSDILEAIIKKIPNGKTVSLPKGIEIAMPSSEKNFIGDIPLGSYVSASDANTMIGIYWRNEWGARDLDLHGKTILGNAIGWNASFNSSGIMFSGDMTYASPEATEVLWFKKKPIDSIISVNRYSGEPGYKMRVFLAQERATDFGAGYMVDPNNIIYQAELNGGTVSDMTIGFFHDGKFVFHMCKIGNGRVPSEMREKILYFLVSTKYITVREVLELAGVTITDENPDVVLATKGDIMGFFS